MGDLAIVLGNLQRVGLIGNTQQCFLGTSSVRMADNSLSPIQDLQIGDEVAAGGQVTGLMRFTAAPGSVLCDFGGVSATTAHRIYNQGNGRFMPTAQFAELTGTGSCAPFSGVLYDIDTENHLIEFENGLTFTDYNEHPDEGWIHDIEKQMALAEAKAVVEAEGIDGMYFVYGSGFGASTMVMMADQINFKPISEIELGDEVAVGGVVTGLFKFPGDDELCRVGSVPNSVLVEDDHVVYSREDGDFIAGDTQTCEEEDFDFLYHLDTENFRIVFDGGVISHSYNEHAPISGIRAAEDELTNDLARLMAGGTVPGPGTFGSGGMHIFNGESENDVKKGGKDKKGGKKNKGKRSLESDLGRGAGRIRGL